MALVIGVTLFQNCPAQEVLTSGAELYHDYCSVCHGDKGDGNSRARDGFSTRPRDFTLPGMREALPREYMIDVLLNGKPNTAMVGWKTRLNQTQAESIVDYIRDTFMTPAEAESTHKPVADTVPQTQPAPAFLTLPMPDELHGDYEAGKQFYENNCATCHGLKGDGQGPRAYFIFPKPRNFLAEESRQRLNRPLLFNAIKYGVRGKEMPAWGKVLDDQQIANITEYVFSAMIEPK